MLIFTMYDLKLNKFNIFLGFAVVMFASIFSVKSSDNSDCMRLLQFKPIYKEKVWGGQNLKTALDKNIGTDKACGESWEVSTYATEQSVVINGRFAGKTLSDLIKNYGELVLGRTVVTSIKNNSTELTELPLLFKFIDAQDNLSVQVHPNEQQAKLLGPGNFAKTECWYIVRANPDAHVIVGIRPEKTRDEVKKCISSGNIKKCFTYVPVHAGDVVFIPAGTPHALLSGVLVYEVQQSSDTTLRMYDWGRPRELHVAAALDVLDFNSCVSPIIAPISYQEDVGVLKSIRVVSRSFALEEYYFTSDLISEITYKLMGKNSFQVITVLDGLVVIDKKRIARGQTILIPACCSSTELLAQNGTRILVSYVPDIQSDIIDSLISKGFSLKQIMLLGGENYSKNDIKKVLKTYEL